MGSERLRTERMEKRGEVARSIGEDMDMDMGIDIDINIDNGWRNQP